MGWQRHLFVKVQPLKGMAAATAWDCSPVNGSGSMVRRLGTAALHLTRRVCTFTLAEGKEIGRKAGYKRIEEAVC